jgi:hypothetical protein
LLEIPLPPAVNLIATSKTIFANLAHQTLGALLQYRADRVPAPYAERGSFAMSAFNLKYFELVVQSWRRLMKAINVMGAEPPVLKPKDRAARETRHPKATAASSEYIGSE